MIDAALNELRQRLFDAPCFVIDFLPRQVPRESGGRCFAVERFLAARPQIDELYGRFARLLLKLNCYCGLAVNHPSCDEWISDPAPQELDSLIKGCVPEDGAESLCVMFPEQETMLTLDGGDLYLALYAGTEKLLETARQLAASEGLFLRPSRTEEQ